MRIKMTTLAAGPAGVRDAGTVHECPLDEARALIAGGYAVAVDAPAAVRETVTAAPAEVVTDAGAATRETVTARPRRGRRGQ
jgi:hypothetical protein